jgi:hypothetical protein
MFSTRTIPGVNDITATVLEVCEVAGRELGPSGLGDGGDLRIGVGDRSAEGAAVTGNPGKSSRGAGPCVPRKSGCPVLLAFYARGRGSTDIAPADNRMHARLLTTTRYPSETRTKE